MNDEKVGIEALRAALRAFVQKSFPKECSCGKLYEDLDGFLTQTTESDYPCNLLQIMGYRDQAVTALARDCECGAPLVVIVNDRRDRTSEGIRVRRDFGRILYALEQSGMQSEEARQELLNVLAGKEDTLITGSELEMIRRLKPDWKKLHQRPTWRDLPASAPGEPPSEPASPPAQSDENPDEEPAELEPAEKSDLEEAPALQRCTGTTKAGAPCKLLALRGSDYCQMHQPAE